MLEILVVLGILSAVLVLAVPRIGQNKNNLKKIMREMTVLGKEIRHHARLKNRTYRLVMEMPEKGAHTYYVESADGPVFSRSQKVLDAEKNLDENNKPKDPFQKDTAIIKKDRELPSTLFFGKVETAERDEVVTEGVAYVYFMPSGLVEQALIQVTDKKDVTWTIIFNPLTGQSDIIEKGVDMRDLRK